MVWNMPKTTRDDELSDKIPSGIAGFDSITKGGFERTSVNLVRGGPGTGKTLFSIQFLYAGIKENDESVVYLSFSESKRSIFKAARLIGCDFEEAEKAGNFTFIKRSPHEVSEVLKEGGGTITGEIEAIGAKRFVLDSLSAYSLLFKTPAERDEGVLDAYEIMMKWNVTSVVTDESDVMPDSLEPGRLGFLCDSITHLYNLRRGMTRVRALEVKKMRYSAHSNNMIPLEIGNNGVIAHPNQRVLLK
jgi:KaiC/GvpD/RAD55 family RecA-like ATPase